MNPQIRAERAFPIRGIREDLPEGEQVLWQGAPAWLDLALTAFHLRQAAVYFGLLLALRLTLSLADGVALPAALRGAAPLVGVGLLCLALLAGLALWSARSTIYAITTRRVVMRVGMALPIVINLPFTGIRAAQLAQRKGGHGDLPLALQGGGPVGYVHLWPYARPWRLSHVEPMMRALPQAAQVAQLLAQALATTGGQAVAPGEQGSTALAAAPAPRGMRSAAPAGAVSGAAASGMALN